MTQFVSFYFNKQRNRYTDIKINVPHTTFSDNSTIKLENYKPKGNPIHV